MNKKRKKNEPIYKLVEANYHKMYVYVNNFYGMMPKTKIDKTFGIHGVKDDNIRILVICAMLSSFQASDCESLNDHKSSKIMREVEGKFLDEVYNKTTDKNDSIALNKIGILNAIGFADHMTDFLKENSYYRFDQIDIAIRAGSELNITNCKGYTILTTVLLNRQFDIANLLLENGYDINLTDDKGRTSLFYVNEGDIDVAEWLLGKGIDVNKIDNMQNTALFHIADLEIANLLINSGAKLDMKNIHVDKV